VASPVADRERVAEVGQQGARLDPFQSPAASSLELPLFFSTAQRMSAPTNKGLARFLSSAKIT
jgi:hypothetical protein